MGKRNGGHQAINRVPLFYSSAKNESLDSPIDRRSDYYRQRARSDSLEGQKPQQLFTIPTILTLVRVMLVPVLAGLWFASFDAAPLMCTLVFMFASVTDCLDGYLARRLKLTTTFGAFLDPVADKLMVATALVLLSTDPPKPISCNAMVIPVIIVIGREITMSALREWAASASSEAHKAVKVNSLGKWKTVFQLSSCTMLMVCRQPKFLLKIMDCPDKALVVEDVAIASWLFLWCAAILAVLSLSRYMSNVWSHFRYPVKEN